MKVLSCALLFGLMVTISEGAHNSYLSASRNVGLGGLTDVIANGPAAIRGLAKKFGIDVHALIEQFEHLIKLLEPIVEPASLKNKIKTIIDLLVKTAKALGVEVKNDILKMIKDLQDKIVPGVQTAMKVAKTGLSAVKTLKL